MGLLRLLLAFCVVIAHLHLPHPLMLGGGDAVKVFFMISGFYMSLVLTGKYSTKSWTDRLEFWTARYLRLYPIYGVVLLLTVIWYLIQLLATSGQTPLPALLEASHLLPLSESIWLWLVNLLGIGADIPSLLGISYSQEQVILLGSNSTAVVNGVDPSILWMGKTVWIAQFWSVGSELWFYLAAPFVVGLAIGPLLSLGLLAFASGYIWTAITGNDTYFFTPYLFTFFLAGILAHRLYCHSSLIQETANLPRIWKALLRGTPILWLIALPSAGLQLPPVVLFGIAFISIPFLFGTSAKDKADRQIGELSYPLYICHLLAFAVVTNIFSYLNLENLIVQALLSVFISLCFAICLDKFIQVPADRFRLKIAGLVAGKYRPAN